MAEGSEKVRNLVRDNVRKMISLGAAPDEVQTYVAYEAQRLPGLTVHGLMQSGIQQHPETLPSQQLGPEMELPLAGLREQEQRTLTVPEGKPGGLANLGAGVGLTVASEVFPPAGAAALSRFANFGREMMKQSAGAAAGFTVGDLVEKTTRGEPLTAESIGDTGLQAFKAAALAAATSTATRGLGEVLAFFRGAGADATAKLGQKFAQGTTFENRALPARAGDFAPRSAAGKLDKASQATSVVARTFAKQQGQKVASFLEEQLVKLSGRPSIIEPTNIVERAAGIIKQVSGPQAKRFGDGVGHKFENAGIWLDQFFSPANSNLLKELRDGNPALFADLKAAWFQRAFREAQDDSVKNAGVMLFNGNQMRAWFEGNKKFLKSVFGDEETAVLDGFTAYMKFASPTAKRAFADSSLKDAAPMATDAALAGAAAHFLGPVGMLAPAASEGVLGGLSWALSRPGNPIYKIFSEATIGGGLRGARIVGQAVAEERGLRFADKRPVNTRIPGAPLPQRETRPTDPRFVPPTFRGLK